MVFYIWAPLVQTAKFQLILAQITSAFSIYTENSLLRLLYAIDEE